MTAPPSILTARWVLPISAAPIQDGYVRVENGKITAVGRMADLTESEGFQTPEEGSILTPGLVNCHLHLEQSFPEPITKSADQPFTEWLFQVVQQLKTHCTPEEKSARCRFGVQELLQTGTTCVNDIASGRESLQALDDCGLRGIVSLEVFHPGDAPVQIAHWVSTFQNMQAGYTQHPRLSIGLSPHSPYNVSPAAWLAMAEACQPALIHTHVAEFEDEAQYLQGKPSCIEDLHQRILGRRFSPNHHAISPVAYLHQHQLLNAQMVLAHAIHTTAADREALKVAGIGIAHCPRSNLALHGQTLRAGDWLDSGIPIGLGTDGRLSTPDLDLRAEARCAMAQHGWNAQQAMEAMTLSGANALGMNEAIGSLSPGKWADLVLWKAQPFENSPESAVLAEATSVQAVIIAGGVRFKRPCHAKY